MTPSKESKTIRQHIHKETGENEAPLEDQRKAWIDYAKTQTIDSRVSMSKETIANVPCLWITRSESPKSPTIVYLHGGGLVDGAIVTHREFVSRLVAESGYGALMVGYRLAPEHRFPASLEDVVAVCDAFPIDRQYILGGDSSGAGLAVAATAELRNKNKRLPVCVFTISGVFDMTLSGESMVSRNNLDPCLSFKALTGWTKHFTDYDLSDPRISPLFGAVTGFPPVLLQVGDHEVWLDDSIRLKEKIHSSGGKAELRIWDSMWHVWHMYSDLPEALEAIKEIGDFIDKSIEESVNQPAHTTPLR
ncbi:MAG: alpha/beta hydrolase [Opitutales bacterium]|nr:alpha/beta hydrolase [Opitutales bacterium]